MIFAIIVLQLISTIPYFYKEDIGLFEFEIGLLILVLEMPIIKRLESKSYIKIGLMIFGLIITSISFLFLIINPWLVFIIISMILLTFGEMIVFPFSNSFALNRAKRGLKGEYMALYSISFSISYIFAHNIGFHLIDALGFHKT